MTTSGYDEVLVEKTSRAKPESTTIGSNATVDEPLDEAQVHLSIYNEINPNNLKGVKEIKSKDDEWNLRMKCIQEWFIRSSWINKLLFVEILCKSTRGCFVLKDVLKSIESIMSKDVLSSLSSAPPDYEYDTIPVDDNRTLDSPELKKVMEEDLRWFVQLNSARQDLVILKLLRLGGGGLVFNVYKMIDNILKENQDARRQSSNVLSNTTLKNKRESKQKLKANSKNQMLVLSSDAIGLEQSETEQSCFTTTKLELLARRESELLNFKKAKGIFPDERKSVVKKSEAVKETVDYLQIMPIWLNRRIMSYIDDKALSEFKKVGKYWVKMIDESINEKSGRKAINAKLIKIVGTKSNESEEKSKENDESQELIMELGVKELIKKKNVTEKLWIDSLEKFEGIFYKTFQTTTMNGLAYRERCCAFDSNSVVLASSFPNNIINFYSLKTGARMNYSVFGIESPITCLALHEDKIHVFVGCEDGSLISKNIRTNKKTASFNGHTKAIKSLFMTSSNLLSASTDNTIKYFQLWSGLCLLHIDFSPNYIMSSVLLRSDRPSLLCIGNTNGVLILADIEIKKPLCKVKLHNDEIVQMAHDGDILITGSKNGKIRIWDMCSLDCNSNLLQPFSDISVGITITTLMIYKDLIFSGCKNGTVKIISLAKRSVSKTMGIASQTPISGLAITEDKASMKLIIWHEGGIEMRSFSLLKRPSNKKSMRKDNQKREQKEENETKENKICEMVLPGYVRNSQGVIEVTPNAYKRTTFLGIKKPLKERLCTAFSLRKRGMKIRELKTDVFTQTLNNNFLSQNDFFLETFSRYQNIISNKK